MSQVQVMHSAVITAVKLSFMTGDSCFAKKITIQRTKE